MSNEELPEENKDYLDISDEDFDKLSFPEDVPVDTDDSDSIDNKEEELEDGEEDSSDTEEGETYEEDEEETYEEDEEEEDSEESEDDGPVEDPEEKKKGGKKEEDSQEENEEDEDDEKTSSKLLKELFEPFKANNRMIKVNTIEDVKTLMKKGANYEQKMHSMKPHLRVIKMLDNHDLLDEGKLNYLIDLHKKDPNAINKIVKDSGIDPLEMNLENTEYQPTNYSVDDKEVELNAVLDDIRSSPAFNTTADIISNRWDNSSKEVLMNSPGIIKLINEHVETGVYDKISEVMETERALGRLSGLSDIEAYKQIGDYLQKQGAFNQTATPDKETINAKAEKETKTKNRKKAASQTRGTVNKNKKLDDFNPLELSDEEIEKMSSLTFS